MKTRFTPILALVATLFCGIVQAADIPITNVVQTVDPATYYLPSDGTFPDSAFTAFRKINTNILSLLLRVSTKADTNAINDLQVQINSLVANTNGITSEIATNITKALLLIATNQLAADLMAEIAKKANTNSPTIWSPTIRSGATLYGSLEIKDGAAEIYFGPDFSIKPSANGFTYTDYNLGKVWQVVNGNILANGVGLTNLQSTNLAGLIPPARMGVNTPVQGHYLRYLNSGSGYWSPLQVALTNVQQSGASVGEVPKWDGTNWVPSLDLSADPGTLTGWLTNWQGYPVDPFPASPTVGHALGWNGSRIVLMSMDQVPPFVATDDLDLFVNSLGNPYQSIEADGSMKFWSGNVQGTVFTAATGFRGLLRTVSGEYPLYDHSAGAPILYYDGTTVSAVSGKKFGGDGSLLTGIGWSTASSWTSNALARVLPNGNGYFGGGAVTISDEGVFSVLFGGNGSQLTSLNANNLASGTVPLARISNLTSNQVSASTDAIYRNTPRVIAGTNVSVTPGTDASGHTTYTVAATGGGGGTNYVDAMYTVGGDPWFGNSSGEFTFGNIGTPGGKITTSKNGESRVDVDGILYVDDGIQSSAYVQAASGLGGGFKVGADEGITDTITIYARNSGNTGVETHTVVIKGGIITSWTKSP